MNPDDFVVLYWTVRCVKANDLATENSIEISAEGDNTTEANDEIPLWQYPAAYLKVEITEYPKEPIETCSYFHVKGKVWNLGYADATEVKVTLSVSPDGSVRPVAGDNGYVITLNTIQGTHGLIDEQFKEFDFYLHCKVACESTLTITPSGRDEYEYGYGSNVPPDENDWHEWTVFPLAEIQNIEEDSVTVKQIEPQVTDYIRTTYPYDYSVFGTQDVIPVTWTVQGFEVAKLQGAKVRVLFYNGSIWEVVAQDLTLESGSFDVDLSTKTIVDPLRCRVRVGIYSPSTGMWLYDGNSQFYDEVGHFWVTDETPTKYIKTTIPNGNMIVKDNDTINVYWDVEGFTGSEGKIRVLFYSGKAWHFVAKNLPLQDGDISFNLSAYTIDDLMRCRVRFGVYVPDPAGSQFDYWYMEGDQAFYDETGHFWVLP